MWDATVPHGTRSVGQQFVLVILSFSPLDWTEANYFSTITFYCTGIAQISNLYTIFPLFVLQHSTFGWRRRRRRLVVSWQAIDRETRNQFRHPDGITFNLILRKIASAIVALLRKMRFTFSHMYKYSVGPDESILYFLFISCPLTPSVHCAWVLYVSVAGNDHDDGRTWYEWCSKTFPSKI